MDNASIRVFDNQEFGEIRTMQEDGNPLFCAKDVATTHPRRGRHEAPAATRERETDLDWVTEQARMTAEAILLALIVYGLLFAGCALA